MRIGKVSGVNSFGCQIPAESATDGVVLTDCAFRMSSLLQPLDKPGQVIS